MENRERRPSIRSEIARHRLEVVLGMLSSVNKPLDLAKSNTWVLAQAAITRDAIQSLSNDELVETIQEKAAILRGKSPTPEK